MFIVDDKFLTDEEVLHYQNLLYLQNQPPWIFSKGSPEPELLQDDKKALHSSETENHSQFVHPAKYGNIQSQPVCDESILLLNKFAKKHDIEVLSVMRVKANLMINSGTVTKHTGTAHVDSVHELINPMSDGKHLVLLYYVNTSDGPTIMYNEKYPTESFDQLSVKEIVHPKAGKAILFDGDQYHASSAPINTPHRFVININFLGKPR